MIPAYFEAIQSILTQVLQEEERALSGAADLVASCVKAGGVIHVFGAGHSHMMAEELFYRAGGLACVNPMIPEQALLHKGALSSSAWERDEANAAAVTAAWRPQPEDLLIVTSNSGRNGVPVEVALEGGRRGLPVIAVSAVAYAASGRSRHSSGKRLHEVADLVLDSKGGQGDVSLSLPGLPVGFGPTSTVVGAAILNAVCAGAIERLLAAGYEPPVFRSGNLEGSDGHNTALIERYMDRISGY